MASGSFKTAITATLSVRSWARRRRILQSRVRRHGTLSRPGGGVAQLAVHGADFWVAEESREHLTSVQNRWVAAIRTATGLGSGFCRRGRHVVVADEPVTRHYDWPLTWNAAWPLTSGSGSTRAIGPGQKGISSSNVCSDRSQTPVRVDRGAGGTGISGICGMSVPASSASRDLAEFSA